MIFAYTKGSPLTAILLAGMLAMLAGCSGEPEPLAVAGSAKAAKLAQCVEPTDFMRRDHMELIKHQRDETVHEGIRSTKHSLAGCIDCHVQLDKASNPVPVDAEDQFCAGCHSYTGVSLNCFQCHSAVPKGFQPAGLAMGDIAGPALAHAAGGEGDLRAVRQEKGN